MGEEIGFAAPRTEDLTKVAIGGVAAGITGMGEGVVIKLAPELGAAQPILTWGTLLGIPLLGAFGALFTRGMLSDLCTGITCGGLGVVGYSLPELLAPITGGRKPLGGGTATNQLAARAALAAQRAQANVKQLASGQIPANRTYIPVMEEEGLLV